MRYVTIRTDGTYGRCLSLAGHAPRKLFRSGLLTASVVCLLGLGLLGGPLRAELPQDLADRSPAERGYLYLTEKPYVSVDFDEQTFDHVWTTWPEALRAKAAAATPLQRRLMAFERYGLTPRPDWKAPSPPRDEQAPPRDDQAPPREKQAPPVLPKPLQYVVDGQGNWTMNCFACHGGQVAGQVIPGAPNNRFAMRTLTEDMLRAKKDLGKELSRNELALLTMPFGTTNGTTNAVMFGVVLLGLRDKELNVDWRQTRPKLVHHDMDAPPWWHFKRKEFIYCDAFARKGHRGLMQFALIPANGPEKFREWEEEFRDIAAYLESVQAPRYPFPVDERLAEQGRGVFQRACAECHGTYGEDAEYPERVVPLAELGTDPVRLKSMDAAGRRHYDQSWLAHYGEEQTVLEPEGYVAPPLDGIWASAPYFHNGSVPTLWHVLHPDQRPLVWRRVDDQVDRERVGLNVESWSETEREVIAERLQQVSTQERRNYFDTRRFGKSAVGHRFPERLSETEKRAVLEYLKTL